MVVQVRSHSAINIEKYRITHFLRIPFATKRSRPQLFQSLKRVAHDPTASILPQECWKLPEQLHFAIGILRLDSARRVQEACQLLRDISVQYHEAPNLDPNGRS